MTARSRLTEELAAYPAGSVTVRVLQGMLAALPSSPPMPLYTSVEDAASHVFGGVPDDVLARARELAVRAEVDQALFAARSIDTGDTGLTIVSGVRSAMALFFGGKEQRAVAVAQQQRADAALKALGLAYLLTRLLPLAPSERVELVTTVPAGQELVLYYGAIEIALPFRDEVRAKNGTFVAELLAQQAGAMADKLLGVVGRQGVADAQEMLGHLVGELDRAAMRAAPHAEALAERIRSVLPAAAVGAGDLFDLVAAGADALPCYRYLCARLGVESALALAKHEIMPDVPLPEVAAPVAAAPTPAPPVFTPPVPVVPVVPVVAEAPAASPAPEVPTAPAPVSEPPDALVPPDDDAPAPPEEPEELDAYEWPTEPLPEDRRLRGVFVEDGAAEPRWQVFTVEGVHSDAPPDTVEPPDWNAHRRAGHRVRRYQRTGDEVVFVELDGTRTAARIARDTYTLTFDGVTWRRADYDLTGRTLDGRWRDPAGSVLVLRPDGTCEVDGSPGRYRLGVGRIDLEAGAPRALTLFSDLRPSSRRPTILWVGGRRYVRDPEGSA